jgi:hypothetical protein
MKAIQLIVALLFLGGCSKIISPTSYTPSSYTLSGVVQLARVQNATVRVYDLNSNGTEGSLLAATTTNSNGEYRFTLPKNTGSVIIRSTGGTFTDEAEQVQKNASDLSSIASGGATSTAPLTPMSTLEADRVKSLLGSNVSLAQAKNAAKGEVARLFGLSAADLSALPDAPNALSLDSSKVKSALAVAAFSHFVKDLYVPDLNSGNKLSSVLAAMREDFKTDGKLDGTYNSNTAKKIAAVWSSKMADAKTAAATNGHLDFIEQNSSVINSVSDFDPGNTTSGLQGDGYYLNGIKTSLNNDGDGVWLGTCFESGEDTGSLTEGTGSCGDKSYFDSVLADGPMTDGKYYLSGELAEFSDGEMSNGKTYVAGLLAQGSMADGKYYFDGRLAQFADGAMADSKYYVSGALAQGSMSDGKYYTNGRLAQFTDGAMADGKHYQSGLLAEGIMVDQKYYVSGVPAQGLISDGKYYTSGRLAQFADGPMVDTKYYASGVLAQGTMADGKYYTSGRLAQFADGPMADTKYYASGVLAQGTMSDGKYYTSGRLAQFSDGAISGKYYSAGVLSEGTMSDSNYYHNGVLAQFADGAMTDNNYYVSGILAEGSMTDGKFYFSGRLAQLTDGEMSDGKYYKDGFAANGTFHPYFYLNGIRSLAVYGCVDENACNYNPSSNTTDSSCSYSCAASTTIYSQDNPDDHVDGDGDHAVADSTLASGNYAWISYRANASIQKRDITNGAWVSDIYLPGNGGSPLLFRVGDYVWAFSRDGGGVWRVHRQTDSVTDFLETLPSSIKGGATSEGFLWILGGTTLYKIDGNSGAVITSLDLSETIQNPQAIAVDSTKIGITGDSNIVFFDKSTLNVIRTVNLPSSNSGFDPTLAYILREGAGGWFTATGGDRSSIYRYDYATDSGRFLDVIIDSIEGIARDSTGFWIPNTHNDIEAAYLYHIKFDGTVDRRLNMDLYYGFNPDWFQGYWYPKTHIAPGGRVWQINYNPIRLLIMDWMSDGSSPTGTCGDFLCDTGETNLSCPVDCPAE